MPSPRTLRALREKNNTGGKLGELMVLDRDITSIPADQIRSPRTLMTVVAGHIVYDDNL